MFIGFFEVVRVCVWFVCVCVGGGGCGHMTDTELPVQWISSRITPKIQESVTAIKKIK